MERSNRDRIDRGLEAVTDGLGPYVLRELKSKHGDRWRDVVVSKLNGEQYTEIRNSTSSETAFLEVADEQVLLKLMWDCYNEVFKNKLGFSGRNQISELMEVRKKWAHRKRKAVFTLI